MCVMAHDKPQLSVGSSRHLSQVHRKHTSLNRHVADYHTCAHGSGLHDSLTTCKFRPRDVGRVSSLARIKFARCMGLQSVMGIIQLLDNPLFRIYVLGRAPVGELKRPFKKEASPFAACAPLTCPNPALLRLPLRLPLRAAAAPVLHNAARLHTAATTALC